MTPADQPAAPGVTKPATSDPQLVVDSGLNWWAIKLVAESAKKCALLDQLPSMSVDVDGIRVTVERTR